MDNESYDPDMARKLEQDRKRKDERTWGMMCHLSAFAAFVVPLGHIFGPLACWLAKKDEHALVDDQGKEALNYQISLTIYILAGSIFAVLMVLGLITDDPSTLYGLPTGVFMLIVLGILTIVVSIANLILIIIASVRANKGEYYRYPFTIRFIK